MSVTSGPRASRRPPRRNPWLGIVLIGLSMVVLFAAGFGLSMVIRNAGGGGASPTTSPAPTTSGAPSPTASPTNTDTPGPTPCVTVTVIPADTLPAPADVTTNVYNATDRTGLAAATAEELKARGFVIGTVANDPLGKTITGVAEVRHGPKGADAARLMAFYLPDAKLVDDGRSDASIDTVLGAGFMDVAPQAEVDAAIDTPTPSPSPSGCS